MRRLLEHERAPFPLPLLIELFPLPFPLPLFVSFPSFCPLSFPLPFVDCPLSIVPFLLFMVLTDLAAVGGKVIGHRVLDDLEQLLRPVRRTDAQLVQQLHCERGGEASGWWEAK